MPYFRSAGDVPRKRHLRTPGPDGALLYEELMGEEGFSGESSLLYHRRSPSAMVDAKTVDADRPEPAENLPLLPRHLRTSVLPAGPPSAGVAARAAAATRGRRAGRRPRAPPRLGPVPPHGRRLAVRRGRLGRVRVPVGPVDPRLRAARRQPPPAAPRPPDLRG